MNDRVERQSRRPASSKILWLLLVALAFLAPLPAHAQDDDKKPKPAKEWVVGYALLTLPMAASMYFMFRMSKRRDFKTKKEEGAD